MVRVSNPFVAFLNRYTTASPDHEAAFDEYVSNGPEPPAGSLRLTTKIEQFLTNQFRQPQPPSVILTGNAGDGKTYLCRQIVNVLQGKEPERWENLIDQPIEYNTMRFFIVKDLSELSEEKGKEILLRLSQTLQTPDQRDRYLIAANEGRLRALLSTIVGHKELKEAIQTQLDQGPAYHQSLIVLNLNRVATSTFVPAALAWMTDQRNWQACNECPIQLKCPIRFNMTRLTAQPVQQRIKMLYEVLERSNEHVTIRDMLIHLAYTISGGFDCTQAQQQVQERADMSYLAYYENIFGRDDDAGFRRKSHVTRLLHRFNIGSQSIFAIDEFIINGGETIEEQQHHQAIFGETVDLHFKAFHQARRAYTEGIESERGQDVLRWLPHCRRKLFFERNHPDDQQLLPFRYFSIYQRLLDQPQGKHEDIVSQLIGGLNRAFSRLYLTQTGQLRANERLYITTQYVHSVNQPHPIVLLTLPIENIRLIVNTTSDQHLDLPARSLYLHIAPPPTQRHAEPVEWPLNILLFEHLMRIADGGHISILADECELEVRRLKDVLIQQFATVDISANEVAFFVPARHRYELRRLRIDEQGRLAIS
ncbi:hypothetical protein A6A03_17705 [Chloroflexus islandicus]|jgi:hypothetical protein|uniref:Uncharacterized protein n=1 Tax=Chloroflexus islandicus TaxID=1707952 RepID=A0A178M522_9CHLR|nr:hypothetical protein [Chloroflexus islandicus]OAN43859.1 hypothetical protein A6A03_17705 [Chloroflexus islandicus]GIV64521.1 MAG: hypothetical protein KatS3mg045_1860 [Bellilinea sp.]